MKPAQAFNTAPVHGSTSMTRATPDPSWRSLYRLGGVSGIVFAVLCLSAMAVILVAPPPVDAGAPQTLDYIVTHRWLYITEQAMWLTICLLAAVVFLALCAAVWAVDKGHAAVVGVVGVSSWLLALALPVTGGGSPVLVSISEDYAAAATDAQRATFASAAESLIAENNTVSAVGILEAVGILLVSLLMLKAALPRWVAWLGVVTGVIGAVSEALRPIIDAAYAGYGTLMLVWFVAVGVVLLRQGRPPAAAAVAPPG